MTEEDKPENEGGWSVELIALRLVLGGITHQDMTIREPQGWHGT